MGQIELIETAYAGETVLRPHTHESAYLTMALSGTFRETSTTGAYDFGPGVVMVRPPGTDHADHFGQDGGRCLVVVLPRGSALGDRVDDLHYASGGPLVTAAVDLYRELRSDDTATPMIVDGVLRQVAGWLERRPGQTPRTADPAWLGRVFERMNDEFLAAPSIRDLAREAGVHPDHLTRCFKQTYGLTPGQWLRDRRLDWAAERLTTGNMPIASVAVRAGFYDQSHFTNAFRGRFGVTPGVHRAARAD